MSIAESSRGGSFSDSDVKLRTSENNTVSLRLTPSMLNGWPDSRICATRAGGTYSPNMLESLRIAAPSRRKPASMFQAKSTASMSSVAAIGIT